MLFHLHLYFLPQKSQIDAGAPGVSFGDVCGGDGGDRSDSPDL